MIKSDMSLSGIEINMALGRAKWREEIYADDTT